MSVRLRFAAAAFVVGFSVLPASASGVIAIDALEAGLATGSVTLVDVREANEFVAGHVPGAVNLPLSRFDPAALPRSEGKIVVVMCRSGNRSGRAQAIAAQAGRGDVVDYSGSMIEWAAKGRPIATGR